VSDRRAPPRLEVAALDCLLDGANLEVRWRLNNRTNEAIEILETWLPHSAFFAARQNLDPPIRASANESVDIERTVRVPAGDAEVENAFLNLRVRYSGARRPVWRLLVRMRVRAAHEGPASVRVESITQHEDGFAESVRDLRQGSNGPA
jgi:hypothetical protein